LQPPPQEFNRRHQIPYMGNPYAIQFLEKFDPIVIEKPVLAD
jgi:hypothetical protein